MAAENQTDKVGMLTKIIDRIKNTLNMVKSGKAQETLQGVQTRVGEAAKKFELPEGAQKHLDSVKGKASEIAGKLTKDMDPEKLAKLKDRGLLAGGAVATVDGVRRIAKKDAEGKRHVVKGVLEAGAGVGMFTAAVLARRNGASNDGPER